MVPMRHPHKSRSPCPCSQRDLHLPLLHPGRLYECAPALEWVQPGKRTPAAVGPLCHHPLLHQVRSRVSHRPCCHPVFHWQDQGFFCPLPPPSLCIKGSLLYASTLSSTVHWAGLRVLLVEVFVVKSPWVLCHKSVALSFVFPFVPVRNGKHCQRELC